MSWPISYYVIQKNHEFEVGGFFKGEFLWFFFHGFQISRLQQAGTSVPTDDAGEGGGDGDWMKWPSLAHLTVDLRTVIL